MVIIHGSLSLLDGLSHLNLWRPGRSASPSTSQLLHSGQSSRLDTKKDVENWDKSDEAGYQTILLNISPDYRFIIQLNQGVTSLQLWTTIKLLNRNNTKGHRGLARQKWQSCKQSAKQSLDKHIAMYGKLHSDFLQSGVVYDREAELSQFLAGLDDRRHPTNGLAILDFQDLTHLGIPSAYTL